MSINHLIVKKELDGYFKKLECNSLILNGSPFVPSLPVRQFTTTYTVSSAFTTLSSTNLYYTADTNELRMRGRLNFTFDGVSPLNLIAVIFVMPDEFKGNFETGVTPIYSGYVSEAYPTNSADSNGLLNQVLLAGGGEILINYTLASTQTLATTFSAVFDVSLIKNII